MRNEPCLSTAHLRELIRKLPDNVYVQHVTIEACRVYRNDMRRTETQMFETRQCYPNLYIPDTAVGFSTPLWHSGKRFDKSNEWEYFINELDQLDTLCNKFDFRGEDDLKDMTISDRLFVKDLLLVELPKDDPNYHGPPYFPQDEDDKFYDGVRCAFASFGGEYQLLGSPIEEIRDGMLPGMTRKPMDMQGIEVVRTKHVRKVRAKGSIQAFHRGKDDIYTEDLEALVNHPERVKTWLPTISKAGLIIWRKVEGDWKESKKFQVTSVSLTKMLEEGEDIELTKEQRNAILKTMKNSEPD